MDAEGSTLVGEGVTTVVGLDLSLTSCGLARHAWTSQKTATEVWHRGDKGITVQPYPDRCRSLVHICADVLAWTEPADLVVVEELVPNPKSRSTNERGALWYFVYRRLLDHEVPILVVHPGTLKRYATGKGNAEKHEIRAAAQEAWPWVKTVTTDEDDALWLASLGMHMLEGPLPYELPAWRLDALSGLRLPDKEAA